MTIDEAIKQERDNAEFSRCNNYDKSAEYHNKIAEWLEELKDYRERECNHINEALYDKGYIDGYNKAMEKAIEIVKGNYRMEALERLEQLKAGGENVQKK